MTIVAVIDKTGKIAYPILEKAVTAFQTQISRDLYPVYGVNAQIIACRSESEAPSGSWFTWIVDVMDNEGLNGYHLVDNINQKIVGTGAKGYAVGTASGNPFGLVKYGGGWTITASHEIIEKLVNPWLDRQASKVDVDQDGLANEDLLMEIADPVQANAYSIDGVMVTNFVYPEYYTDVLPIEGRKYDYMGVISKPKEIAEGGYFSFKRGSQWYQGFKTLNVVIFKSLAEGKGLTSSQATRLVRQIFWILLGGAVLGIIIKIVKDRKNK